MSIRLVVRLLVGLPLVLIAVSIFQGQLGGLPKVVEWYGLGMSPVLSVLAGGLLIIAAVLIVGAQRYDSLRRPAVLSLLVIAVIPLLTLLGPGHWIEELGGFPAIGSGQGIIKYVSLLSLALSLLAMHAGSQAQTLIVRLNYLPVALVLLWIGGMKFTQVEAQAIERLVDTSPLMSWMYQLMDLQTTSNVIGLYDLVALLLLGLGLAFPRFLVPGLLMCAAVFLTTQTFLLSYEGSIASGVLSGSGIFIIKDLWFVANLLLIYRYRRMC